MNIVKCASFSQCLELVASTMQLRVQNALKAELMLRSATTSGEFYITAWCRLILKTFCNPYSCEWIITIIIIKTSYLIHSILFHLVPSVTLKETLSFLSDRSLKCPYSARKDFVSEEIAAFLMKGLCGPELARSHSVLHTLKKSITVSLNFLICIVLKCLEKIERQSS